VCSAIKEGNGPSPQKGQKILVDCTGYLKDGMKKFWSTKDPGQKAFAFNVGIGQVVRGWDEGSAEGNCATRAC